MSPFHSYPFLARPHHDCQSSSLRYRPFRASTRHCCPTTPPQISPHRSNPKLPRLISPIHSTQHHDCLIAPHHASSIKSLPLLPLQNPSSSFDTRPIHELPVLCTFPALPFRSLTCRSRPIRSSANLPNQASPNETSRDLDCQNIRHPTKPHLFYPLNSSTA
jgi:hypothetical protein